MPDSLSEGCKDLIRGMLTVSLVDRITMGDIMDHEWFKAGLPTYIANQARYRIVNTPSTKLPFDAVILAEISDLFAEYGATEKAIFTYIKTLTNHSFGRDSEDWEDSDDEEDGTALDPDLKGKITVAYQLMLDSKMEEEYLYSESAVEESEDTLVRNMSLKDAPFSLEVLTKEHMSPQKRVVRDTPLVTESTWFLGLISSEPPREIMLELLRVLRLVGYEWKSVNAYRLRIRSRPGIEDIPTEVKMDVQLYKVKRRRYLLDFKILTSSIAGLDAVKRLLEEIQVSGNVLAV